MNNKTVKLATNVGFRLKNNSIHTYSQDKVGFNYFYCKREVLSDGISTIPLKLTLSPWNEEVELVEQVQHPLSNLFPVKITHEGITFNSSEHIFHYQLAKHYNKQEICKKILLCPDPADVHSMFFDDDFDLNINYELQERLMRFSILLKFNQSNYICQVLKEFSGKVIYYKQINFNKAEAAFWGVSNPSNLIPVLPSKSIAGNNVIGKILMEYAGFL